MSQAVVIINLQDWDRLTKRLKPDLFVPVVNEALDEIGTLGKSAMMSRVPRFTGHMARNVRVIKKAASYGPLPVLMGIGPTSPHRFLVERGTKPHMPATSPDKAKSPKSARRLRNYVRRKFHPQPEPTKTGRRKANAKYTPQERAIQRATFAFALAIARKGTAEHRFMRPAYVATQGHIDGIIGRAAQRLQSDWLKAQ